MSEEFQLQDDTLYPDETLIPQPTSTLMRLRHLSGGKEIKDVWVWGSGIANLKSIPEVIEETRNGNLTPLTNQGNTNKGMLQQVSLHSQFRPFVILIDAHRQKWSVLAAPSDIEAMIVCPVMLASSLQLDGNVQKSDRMYPPREHGTIGLVSSPDGVADYSIFDLPATSQHLQERIAQRLDELEKQPQDHTVPLFSRDKEVRALVQQLAMDYYVYHQNNRHRPEIVHAFNADGIAKMLTCLPVQAYSVAATAPSSAWREYTSDKENELIMGIPYQKPSGNYHVLMKEDATGQDREQVLARMKKSIEDMGDYDSDLFMMMVLQLIVGRRNENGNVVMSAHKALEYHNTVAKKNPRDQYGIRTGGLRWEDLEKWSASYLRMKNKWMKLDSVEILDDDSKPDKRGRRKHTTINREAPLFLFDEVITHETLPYGSGPSKKIAIAWEYREASWMLPFVKGSNVYTSGILQDCFMFDPTHEQWEKRLSKHFFFWLRTNAKNERLRPICIRDLFSELHLKIDRRNPARSRDHFEEAMNILAEKIPRTITKQKVLRPHLHWEYVETFKFPRKNWLETWLSQQIIVTPPEINQNAHILAAAQARREQIQTQQIKAEAAAKKRGRPRSSKNKK